MNVMNKSFAILAMLALSANASAECISASEKNWLKLQALVFGSVKLFVSHADLPLGTSVEDIQTATANRVAELNSTATLVYVTQSWVPPQAPGFEAFVTAAGVEKLFQKSYCFGKIG